MKRWFLQVIALLILLTNKGHTVKHKRGTHFGLNYDPTSFGTSSTGDWQPLQHSIPTGQGLDGYFNLEQLNPVEINLKVNLPPPSSSVALPVAQASSHIPISSYGNSLSNSVEKPVQEAQEYVPPQSVGTAVIPQLPPPATPVNAAASNVPAERGAVFLGSGSLGVVNLGNGQYALGSGSIGYSGQRSQPRPSFMVPVYPPLPATPNLIPAAIPSQAPTQPILPPPPPFPQIPNTIDFNNVPNFPPPPKQIDQNGYEFLPPNQVGFGGPNPNPVRLKTTQAFATPTNQQIPLQQLPTAPAFNIPPPPSFPPPENSFFPSGFGNI